MYYITIVFVAVTILRSWLGFCMGLAPGRGEPVEANQLPPELDDEVQFSPHVPSKLSCESCAAIVHQLTKQIRNLHHTISPRSEMKDESTMTEAMTDICDNKYFEEYGVKTVDGMLKLNGPGLEAMDLQGLAYSSAIWSSRLSRRCEEYIGEAEDYKLYKIVLEAESPEMAERALFENLCVDVDNNQLNNCGEGKIKALHSDFWKKNVNPYKAYQDEEYQPDFSSNDNDDSSLPPDDEL